MFKIADTMDLFIQAMLDQSLFSIHSSRKYSLYFWPYINLEMTFLWL